MTGSTSSRSFQREPKEWEAAEALSAKAVTALEAAPTAARDLGLFFLCVCVDGGAAEKQLDFPLHRPPPLVLRSPR